MKNNGLMNHGVLRLGLWLAVLLLTACAHRGAQVGHTVTLCCPGEYQNYQTYSLMTEDIPGFLRESVVVEFNKAFQEKGLSQQHNNADLQVTLSYRHVNLNPQQQDVDPFGRRESLDAELHYLATIVIEIREAATDYLVWAGQIQRRHRVSPGEYMHEDSSRGAILMAFRQVLTSYPALDQ